MKIPLICVLAIAAHCGMGSTRLNDAIALEAQGKLKDANEVLRAELPDLRKSGSRHDLALALSLSGRIAVSLGDYSSAIRDASEAIAVRRQSGDGLNTSEDLTTLGLANLYLAKYDEALSNYEKALALDTARNDAEGMVARENNIGNVYYFRGRYSDALLAYQAAMREIEQNAREKWVPWRRQLTLANQATLYQRLGQEQHALNLYRQMTDASHAMPPSEFAQVLLNEGVLYRRMGDPVKALELYGESQKLFATSRNADGEVGALRNIGIARSVDLDDAVGALAAFSRALDLAGGASNMRGVVQAALYRGEVLRRLKRLPDAERDFRVALAGAQGRGLVEEQWKALYGLGRIAEDRGATENAVQFYRQAISQIESMRAGLRQTTLKSEFLADKRDVYDALIGLALSEPSPPVSDIFSWMERSRARTLEERLHASNTAPVPSIPEIQTRLQEGTVLLEVWAGNAGSAVLWITKNRAAVVRVSLGTDALQEAMARLNRSVAQGGGDWKTVSGALGGSLLAGVPIERHVIVAPDGPLSTLPFELLTEPVSGGLLIEKCDVSYIPAARFLVDVKETPGRWAAPWRTELLALGDPPVSGVDPLAREREWQPLPDAGDEIRGIAAALPGRAEIHVGRDARKVYLFRRSPRPYAFIDFSTHAVVDPENPDRSRILLAGEPGRATFDYLFLEDVYGLDLRGVQLVTVSACDTARGKVLRGEGVQAFSAAFLAAGASATVTSLWKVADGPTADFMKQLYFYLGRHVSKAEALRAAKLKFLNSGSALQEPRYWAAFVLTGDGWNPTVRVIPWSYLAALAGCLLLIGGVVVRLKR